MVRMDAAAFPTNAWHAAAFLRFPSVVAEGNGELIGFVTSHLTFNGDGLEPSEFEILKLVVTPTWRRQGVGSRLLQSVLRPDAAYFLEVRVSNESAQSLYRQFGFEVIGHRPGYYQNPSESALVMRRKTC